MLLPGIKMYSQKWKYFTFISFIYFLKVFTKQVFQKLLLTNNFQATILLPSSATTETNEISEKVIWQIKCRSKHTSQKWQVLRNSRTIRVTEHQPVDPQLHACSELSGCHGNRDRLHPHLVAISALVKEKKKGGGIYELRRKKTNIFCNAKQKKAEGWVTHERGWEMSFVYLFFP